MFAEAVFAEAVFAPESVFVAAGSGGAGEVSETVSDVSTMPPGDGQDAPARVETDVATKSPLEDDDGTPAGSDGALDDEDIAVDDELRKCRSGEFGCGGAAAEAAEGLPPSSVGVSILTGSSAAGKAGELTACAPGAV